MKCHMQSPWHIVGAHVNSLSKSYIRNSERKMKWYLASKGKGRKANFPFI